MWFFNVGSPVIFDAYCNSLFCDFCFHLATTLPNKFDVNETKKIMCDEFGLCNVVE